jgi:hypothetical protein
MTKNKSTDSWATESHELAESFAFKNIEEDKEIKTEYMNGARQIVNKRLALAGYRLADLMMEIYTDFLKPEPKSKPTKDTTLE